MSYRKDDSQALVPTSEWKLAPTHEVEYSGLRLPGDHAEVNAELMGQLTERLSHAGVEILEVRLSHLAYAPEIAGVMLRRQQAEAIIDARQRIVEQLDEQEVVQFDAAQKAAMVSNLLVVLCSETEVQPVVSAGS